MVSPAADSVIQRTGYEDRRNMCSCIPTLGTDIFNLFLNPANAIKGLGRCSTARCIAIQNRPLSLPTLPRYQGTAVTNESLTGVDCLPHTILPQLPRSLLVDSTKEPSWHGVSSKRFLFPALARRVASLRQLGDIGGLITNVASPGPLLYLTRIRIFNSKKNSVAYLMQGLSQYGICFLLLPYYGTRTSSAWVLKPDLRRLDTTRSTPRGAFPLSRF